MNGALSAKFLGMFFVFIFVSLWYSMICSSGSFVVSSEAAPGGDAPDEVNYCGNAHGEAYDVVP